MDPAIHLRADGVVLCGKADGETWRCRVPARVRRLIIAGPGVRLRGLELRGRGTTLRLRADHPALTEGFLPADRPDARRLGQEALLPPSLLAAMDGAFVLTLRLAREAPPVRSADIPPFAAGAVEARRRRRSKAGIDRRGAGRSKDGTRARSRKLI